VRRNVRGCTGAGFCDFGCPTDARRSTNVSAIPAALQRGAMLLTEATVERVLLESGRAAGVEMTSRSGRRIRVRARKVVLAGGAVPTPLLLLKQGLCARSGQVGRNLTLHPSASVSALMDDEINGFRHIPQGYGCDQFLRDGELILAAQPDVNIAALLFPVAGKPLQEIMEALPRTASLGLLARDATANGRVWGEAGGRPIITYRITQEDRKRIHSGMVHALDLLVAAGARRLFTPVSSAPILEPRELDRFRRSAPEVADLSLASYHPLGTCRMGKDPKRSVVGLDHQAHDTGGLFIVDGSTVPSALGVNPQLTIMAMAVRAADAIHETLATDY